MNQYAELLIANLDENEKVMKLTAESLQPDMVISKGAIQNMQVTSFVGIAIQFALVPDVVPLSISCQTD